MRDELERHLTLLKRQGWIADWHDRRITAGQEWKGAIDRNLEGADIILLLVSAYFIESDYCWDVELSAAMDRHTAGSAVVIPIFLRPCDTHDAPFMRLQGLPPDEVPVSSWSDPHEAWATIAQGIRSATEGWARRHRFQILGSTHRRSRSPSEPKLVDELSSQYLSYLADLPLIDLVRGSIIIENKIIGDLNADIERTFLANGFERKGAYFENSDQLVKYSMSLVDCPGGHRLKFFFETTPGRKWSELDPIPVKEFGKIREISITSSDPQPVNLDALLAQFVARVRTAYSAL